MYIGYVYICVHNNINVRIYTHTISRCIHICICVYIYIYILALPYHYPQEDRVAGTRPNQTYQNDVKRHTLHTTTLDLRSETKRSVEISCLKRSA